MLNSSEAFHQDHPSEVQWVLENLVEVRVLALEPPQALVISSPRITSKTDTQCTAVDGSQKFLRHYRSASRALPKPTVLTLPLSVKCKDPYNTFRISIQ